MGFDERLKSGQPYMELEMVAVSTTMQSADRERSLSPMETLSRELEEKTRMKVTQVRVGRGGEGAAVESFKLWLEHGTSLDCC